MNAQARVWVLFAIVAVIVGAFLMFGRSAARLSALILHVMPMEYESPPEPPDSHNDKENHVPDCTPGDTSGDVTIVLINETPLFSSPNAGAAIDLTLPAGTSYRIISQTTVEGVVWYEIDGPCHVGADSGLWFPETSPFSVVAGA